MEKPHFPYKLYHTIGEVARHFGINESKLRFWEKEFENLSPKRTEKGTRKYSAQDIKQVKIILELTQNKGLTLKGTNKLLQEKAPETTSTLEVVERLKQIRKTLLEIKSNL